MILVTGSTGFIGSQLCRALVDQGYKVRAFHRRTSPLQALGDLPVEHALGDLTQPATLRAAMDGVQAVFHAAARVGDKGTPEEMYAVTVEGTRQVLEAASEAGVRRVVHTSSVAALGVPDEARHSTPIPLLINENHTWNERPERWRYGHAKYLAELAVQEAVARGLDVVIVNPTVVVGAGDVNRVSGEIILRVARGQVPAAIPGGMNVVHIEDIIQGHLAAWERGRRGERYILGGENISHRRFLELTAEITGAPPPRWVLPTVLLRKMVFPLKMINKLVHLPISGETLYRTGYYFYYDTIKSRLQLGLPNPRSVRDALQQAYSWYRKQGII